MFTISLHVYCRFELFHKLHLHSLRELHILPSVCGSCCTRARVGEVCSSYVSSIESHSFECVYVYIGTNFMYSLYSVCLCLLRFLKLSLYLWC